MRRRRNVLMAAAAMLAAAVIAWWWTRSDGDHAPPPDSEPAASAAKLPAAAPPATRPSGDDATTGPRELTSADRMRRELAAYERSAVYPHWSRPHYDGSEYKLDWNEAITSELPLGEDSGLIYRFGADRMHVMWGAPYTSWIEVWHANRPGELIPIDVDQAWVMVMHGANQGRGVPLTYNDEGRDGDAVAGDGRYTNRFVPSRHEQLADTDGVRIRATIEAEGEQREILRDLTFAARPTIEVVGTSDAIVDGSLVVSLQVVVHEAGLYTFEANLMSGDGATPIAYSTFSYQLEPGRAQADLVFFGKAIRDKAIAAPWLARDFRGFRRALHDGEANQWWSDPRTHLTGRHDLDELSGAEWDAPEKRDKIAAFERLIDEADARGQPAPDEPPPGGGDTEGTAPSR